MINLCRRKLEASTQTEIMGLQRQIFLDEYIKAYFLCVLNLANKNNKN